MLLLIETVFIDHCFDIASLQDFQPTSIMSAFKRLSAVAYSGSTLVAPLVPRRWSVGFPSVRCFATQMGPVGKGSAIGQKKKGAAKHKPPPKTEVKWFTGDFDGELKDEKRHGFGTYVSKEHRASNALIGSTTYVGTWEDNKRSGFGKSTIANGNSYEGEWQNNKPHGKGTITYVDGKTLEGTFRDGLIWNGVGRWVPGYEGDAKGGLYEGTWVEGKMQGKGVWVGTDGSSYAGDWLDGARHGQGTEESEGFTYTGEWRFNKRCGYGKATYQTGHSYEGEWADDQYHGAGTITYADGATLVGTFQKHVIYNGTGRWMARLNKAGSGGSVYEGTWVDGKLQGYAVCRNRKDGYTYEGEWRDGKRHGKGVVAYSTGERLEGEFREGKIWSGEGSLRKVDKTWLKGRWVDGEHQAER